MANVAHGYQEQLDLLTTHKLVKKLYSMVSSRQD